MLLKAINRTKGRPVKYIAFFTFCFYTQERKKAFILLSGYCMGQKQKHNRRKSTDKEQPDLYREEAVSCGQIEQIGGSLSGIFPAGKFSCLFNRGNRSLAFLGKNSLIFYLLHQPLILVLLYLVLFR